MRSYTREKKIWCGDRYLEVDVIPRTFKADQYTKKGIRSKRKRESEPKQKNLNQKNAKRYLIQLVNANFYNGDYFLTLTYQDPMKPETIDAALKEVGNYIRRIKRLYKNAGHDLQYILVTEGGDESVRINHHIVLKSAVGVTRDEIEELWAKGRGRNRKQLGYANCKTIRANDNGVTGIASYLSKDPKGKKRWSSSKNLARPISRTNDHKYSQRRLEKLAKLPDQGQGYFENMYKGYQITELEIEYFEMTGWHVYLKMWRI
mgnify:FL=1